MAQANENDIRKIQRGLLSVVQEVQKAAKKAEFQIANRTMANLKVRVFQRGKASNGRIISSRYSTKPFYVSLSGARNSIGSQAKTSALTPKGKNSRSRTFKNGRIRKSMYLKDGYKELRETLGRQTSTVDAELTGDLRNSIQVVKSSNNTAVRIVDAKNQLKAAALEARYRVDIFSPSDQELREIDKFIETTMDDAIFNALGF